MTPRKSSFDLVACITVDCGLEQAYTVSVLFNSLPPHFATGFVLTEESEPD
jgi:hypothetical protein